MPQNQIIFYDEFVKFCLVLAQTFLSIEFFCGLFLGFIIGGAVIFWHKRHENDRLLKEIEKKDNAYLSQNDRLLKEIEKKDAVYLAQLQQKDDIYLTQLQQKDFELENTRKYYLQELDYKNQEIQSLRKRISSLEIGEKAKNFKLAHKKPL